MIIYETYVIDIIEYTESSNPLIIILLLKVLKPLFSLYN